MPSNHPTLCRPILLLPSIFPSIKLFSNDLALHIRWPNYWSFSISPSNEYSGLISFRIDWLDLLAVQGTLKSLLQHHSSKASIFQHSACFIVQLAHLYMTTGKTTGLTRRPFVGIVMSLLLNTLSSFVIASLLLFHSSSSKEQVSFNFMAVVTICSDFGAQERESIIVSIISPIYLIWSDGPRSMIFVFWMLSLKPTFSLSSFTFLKRLFSSSLSAIKGVSSAYLRSFIFLPAILIPACASSSPAFLLMYSAYKLNKQGDNIQPWHTPFPI